jgi:hypothetical protein
MLSEARGPVTQWKLKFQPNWIFSSFYANTQCLVRQESQLLHKNSNWWYYYYYFLSFFKLKPRFHQQIILQISRHTFLNVNLVPHRTNANVLVIINSIKWCLSNPTDEWKNSDFERYAVFNMLNKPMICKPQLWCNHAQTTT